MVLKSGNQEMAQQDFDLLPLIIYFFESVTVTDVHNPVQRILLILL